MDDTWRKVKGTAAVLDGAAIVLAVETIDGRTMVVQLVPEMVSLLVAELVNAKTRAEIRAAFAVSADCPPDPVHMRQPIDAERLILTDYADRDHSLVQVLTRSGGIFEFMVPVDGALRREARD